MPHRQINGVKVLILAQNFTSLQVKVPVIVLIYYKKVAKLLKYCDALVNNT